LAIFWNEVYRRIGPGRYLLLLWVVAILPLGAVALFSSPWPVLTCLLLSATANGGIQPINADILRNCYPPSRRSRVFSVLKAGEQLVTMAVAYGIAVWMDRNPNAYRYVFPTGATLVGLGMLLMHRVPRKQLFVERLQPNPTMPFLRSVLLAWHGMAGVLRRDPDFRQFETAYTTYGLGWMMCYALIPFIAVDLLKLNYQQFVWSAQWSQQLTILVMLVPFGLIMERIGPIRFSVGSFLPLLVYPLGLLFVWNWQSLAVLSVFFGLSMTGVNLVWTIAPVTLAKDASQAPHYLAIHATLVALRGVLGQLPAVAVYWGTGQTRPTLIAAAVLFVVATIIMSRLDRRMRTTPRPPPIDAVGPGHAEVG